MLTEFEQGIGQRIAAEAARQDTEFEEEQAESQEARAAWQEVYDASETLLEEQGNLMHFGVGTKIADFLYYWTVVNFSHGFPPAANFGRFSKTWGMQKDVDFDGEVKTVTVITRADKHSPKNADTHIISIGELTLVDRELYLGRQEVPAELADANFFKEVLARTREQAGIAAPVPTSNLWARSRYV